MTGGGVATGVGVGVGVVAVLGERQPGDPLELPGVDVVDLEEAVVPAAGRPGARVQRGLAPGDLTSPLQVAAGGEVPLDGLVDGVALLVGGRRSTSRRSSAGVESAAADEGEGDESEEGDAFAMSGGHGNTVAKIVTRSQTAAM